MCDKSTIEQTFDIDDILCYSKRQIYLPFTIAASGGCERARKGFCRFAARARRGVNDQNENHFDVYDKNGCIAGTIRLSNAHLLCAAFPNS